MAWIEALYLPHGTKCRLCARQASIVVYDDAGRRMYDQAYCSRHDAEARQAVAALRIQRFMR